MANILENDMVKVLLVLLVVYFIISYMNKEKFESIPPTARQLPSQVPRAVVPPIAQPISTPSVNPAVNAVVNLANAAAQPSAANPNVVSQLAQVAASGAKTQQGSNAIVQLANQAAAPSAGDKSTITALANTAVKSIISAANQDDGNFSPAPPSTGQRAQIDKIVAGVPKLVVDDLLPKYDDANAFAKENPVSKLLKEQNFLIGGYHVGVNTVMQSNKIAYHDIRSLPPIPKENVGPWNQSSYEQSPSQMRKSFEIGV